mmetsp:Transcript_13707/g.26484  ORF Transcript_13707/g.26484 Transcript_13707/m.26484 type:complete len:113 (-) Transcript_13707:92-430(-)
MFGTCCSTSAKVSSLSIGSRGESSAWGSTEATPGLPIPSDFEAVSVQVGTASLLTSAFGASGFAMAASSPGFATLAGEGPIDTYALAPPSPLKGLKFRVGLHHVLKSFEWLS